MTPILTILLLTVAVSLDSFTVALTYGLRDVLLSVRSVIVIGVISAIVFFIAMIIGNSISVFITPFTADIIGGSLLVCIGVWVLISVFRSSDSKAHKTSLEWKIEIKSLGLVIQILKKPMLADMDRSGNITGIEVVLLGVALSLDSFAAGIGSALVGLPIILSAISIGLATSTFLFLGLQTGKRLSNCNTFTRLSILPGILLILIGIIKMV
ncbi:manganese efflux pump MntP [Paraliobacillus sp. PM-2]|uniref:sporulation membrane protein YtaF n=1 Tax=Paraliobacillus sp. PM-2 TaxID=1462524 RepID=UPI00061BBD55|nr:sporulation membrane protein YtaF [Paraliobacillus sp. PM-2]CQR48103.1 manganese efflux pump MntP [Paraliobacillus sp. PM-2]